MTDNSAEIERIARIARDYFISWAKTQPNCNQSQLRPYSQLSEREKELFRQVGMGMTRYGIQQQIDASQHKQNVCKDCFKRFSWQNPNYCIECWIKRYQVEPQAAENLRSGEYLYAANCDRCKKTNKAYCNNCMD